MPSNQWPVASKKSNNQQQPQPHLHSEHSKSNTANNSKMESTNYNSQMLFVCELKELRKELSAVKKRIVQLEDSHEKQQERINVLERENLVLKKKTQLNIDGNTDDESVLKRKRTNENTDQKIESKPPASVSVSTCKKKTRTNNNNDDDDETVVISRYDNGDSFDSLSDDLLHKIVEFDGNCYSKFGSINKRCRNIYDVEEYKLEKQTCVFGYGTVDMMLERYLQKRKEMKRKAGMSDEIEGIVKFFSLRHHIAISVIFYERLDAIDWIIQLGDIGLLKWVLNIAACNGKIDILSKVFCKCNLTILDELLNYTKLCSQTAYFGKLETLKWLRKYDVKWDASTFTVARDNGHDEMIQYLRAEGCPEPSEDGDESSGSGQFDSDDEDSDY